MAENVRFQYHHPMTDHKPLEQLALAVEDVADWHASINEHIDNENYSQASPMVWAIPDKKAAMGQAQAASRNLPQLPPDELRRWIDRIRTATQRLQEAEGRLARNIHKVPLLTDLLKDPSQISAAADFMIPDGWNVSQDVFVLVGRHSTVLAKELLNRGQVRLFCYVPEDTRSSVPVGAIGVTTVEELTGAIEEIPGDPPQHAVTQMTDDECGGAQMAETIAGKVYEAMVELRANLNTVDKFGQLWVTNVLDNLPHIPGALNARDFGDHLAGKPMVVISTGPSLSKNIDQLAQLKGKAILVALNHSLSAMTEAGIMPDIAIALEAQDLTYHFEGFDIEKGAALVLSTTVRSNLFQLPAPRKIAFSGSNIVDDWVFRCLNETATLSSGGSVANNALSLAMAWKCDPVIFVGQDLALTDGKFYAATSVDGDMAVQMTADNLRFTTTNYTDGFKSLENVGGEETSKEAQTIEVPGYHGGTVLTTGPFNIYRRWFESAALYFSDSRFWNCTEGGAYIKGMEHIPLAEAINRISQERVDVSAAMDKAWEQTDWDNRRALMKTAATDLNTALHSCLSLARRCMSLVDKARTSPNALRKLGIAENELVQSMQPIIFISQVQQRAIREIMTASRESKDLQEMLDLSKKLYRLILNAKNYLEEPLTEALRELAD